MKKIKRTNCRLCRHVLFCVFHVLCHSSTIKNLIDIFNKTFYATKSHDVFELNFYTLQARSTENETIRKIKAQFLNRPIKNRI